MANLEGGCAVTGPTQVSELEFGECCFCESRGEHRNMMSKPVSEGDQENYFEMLLECFNVYVATGSMGRSLICASCACRLRDARDFKQLVLRAHARLRGAATSMAVEVSRPVSNVKIKLEFEEPPGETAEPDPDYCGVVVKSEPDMEIVEHGLMRRTDLKSGFREDNGTTDKMLGDGQTEPKKQRLGKQEIKNMDTTLAGMLSCTQEPMELKAENDRAYEASHAKQLTRRDCRHEEIVQDANPDPNISKSAPGDLAIETGISETTTASTPAVLETTNTSTTLCASLLLEIKIEEPDLDSSQLNGNKPKSILPCIFCSKPRLRVGSRRVQTIKSSSESTLNNIRMYATALENEAILSGLQSRVEIAYHKECYSTIRKKYFSAKKKCENSQEPSIWHSTREIHKAAFKSISELIEDEIINNGKIYFITDLYTTFKSLLIEFGDGVYSSENTDDGNVTHFCDVILKIFGDRVIIEASDTPLKKRMIYSMDLNVSQLAQDKALRESADTTKLEQVAFEVRNSVKTMPVKKLPPNLKVENIMEGECEVPEPLFHFLCSLVQGPSYRREKSDVGYTKIYSLCSDIMYFITKGRIKPAKQLTLGLAMKSLTSSRKVLDILNCYGHTISYSAAEELETEITFAEHASSAIIPTSISNTPGLTTHVAYDNFDRFVNTASGKDTLDDTVGIIYQFRSPSLCSEAVPVPSEIATTADNHQNQSSCATPQNPRKRRKLSEIPINIEPYYKTSKNYVPLLPYDTIKVLLHDFEFAESIADSRDMLWALSFSQLTNIPMWIGFDCMTTIDESEMQVVDYLPPINRSLTSHEVVNQTLENAAAIASHCQQSKIIVTYDLVIAKMAMLIQHNEDPKYNDIFINVGALNLQMAYFKAVGKFIDFCGITDILIQCEVLAGGSINSFIDSRHFNRCKRLHPQVSVALQTLYLERFLSENEVCPEILVDDLNVAVGTPVAPNDVLDMSAGMRQFLDQYKNFRDATLCGAHGKTAQFYLIYVELINEFFHLSRAIRTSNFELYVTAIFNIADLFFILNQPNYAKWSVKYVCNLLTLKTTNSDLLHDFKRGAFGVKRTSSNLARAPVDLTLEQTINRDAENSLTGISHFTDSISASQRWAISHSIKTKIISKVLEKVGIARGDDISYELSKSKIENDRTAVAKIVDAIKQNINPFDYSLDPNSLFHITTGRAASSSVADFLLNAKSLGRENKIRFIKECEDDESRFSRPLKRHPIMNFASESMKKAQKSADGSKHALITMERDVFGRLLAIALEKKIDIAVCLTYPLAPAPPAFANYTGDMHATERATLGRLLKSKVDSVPPVLVDIDIIDGFYFLHTIGASLPQSFGQVAETILFKICNTNASEIHMVFDRYSSPSIKDCTREKRCAEDIPYNIVGADQTRPTDFLNSLRNRKFKEALVSFLAEHWANDSVAPILQRRKVFLTVEDRCFAYQVIGKHVTRLEDTNYTCSHEEGGTRILFHISKADPKSRIVIKASDTDILIILLGNVHKFPEMKIWMRNSSAKASDKQVVDCSKLATALGPDLCRALPGFHAFTGCDYTAAFFRKGKVRPYRILENNERLQKVFASLNDRTNLEDENIVDTLQEFTSQMYSVKNCKRVDAARFELFQKLYSGSGTNEIFLKKIKGFDSSLIPPCFRSLKQKILRTIYVTNMWLNATSPRCVSLHFEEYGWEMREKLQPLWYTGQPTPLLVDDILDTSVETEENSDDEFDFATFDSDDEN